METIEDVYHRLGQIEAKIDALLLLDARLKTVENWQLRAQTHIAASVAILTIGVQVLKEFWTRTHTS